MTAHETFGPVDEPHIPVIIDPQLTRALEIARHQQLELDGLPQADQAHLTQIVQELNEEWPYFAMPLKVTGRISSTPKMSEEGDRMIGDNHDVMVALGLKTDEELHDYEQGPFFIEGEEFMSAGFCIDPDPHPIVIGGMELGTRYVIKLGFQRLMELKGNQKQVLTFQAGLNEISIDAPIISDEMAEITAYSHFPDFFEYFDEVMDDEMLTAKKLMLLKGIDVYYDPRFAGNDEMESLAQHVNQRIGVQEETHPYFIRLEQDAVLFDGDNPATVLGLLNEGRCLAEIKDLQLVSKTLIENSGHGKVAMKGVPNNLEFRIRLTISGLIISKDSDMYSMRLTDVHSLRNVREYFHLDEVEDGDE